MAVSLSSPQANKRLYFSSDFRQVVVHASGNSVSLTLYCARYGLTNFTLAFRTNYIITKNSATIYDLNQIIDNYTFANSHSAMLTVRITLQSGSDYATYDLPVLFCQQIMPQTDPFNFSFYNFLTNTQNFIVTKGEGSSMLNYFVHAGVRAQVCEIHLTMRKSDGTLQTYHRYFLEENPEAGVYNFPCDYGSLISDDRYAPFPEDGEPVAYTIKVGQRTAHFYVVDYPHHLHFFYENKFGLMENCFLPLSIKQKANTKQSMALSLYQYVPYDRQHTIEYECQTAALTTEHALQSVEMLQSHRILLDSRVLPFGTQIIINDYTAELSDNPGEQVAVKFNFQFKDKDFATNRLIADRFTRIFSDEFSDDFV